MTEPVVTDTRGSRDTYYARAASWAEDRQKELQASRRVAWIIAGTAASVAALEAIALIMLVPLQTVVPYTLLVDRNTGYVQALKGTDTALIAPDAALTQSLLAQYVIAREGFDITSIEQQYRKVALWSGDTARRTYLAEIPATNPDSPFRRLPRTSVVAVTVRSVSPIAIGTALVRFEAQRLDQGQTGGPRASYVAVIRYRYSGAPMAIEDRFVNPLGFQVTHYRRDQEAVASPEPYSPTPTAKANPVSAGGIRSDRSSSAVVTRRSSASEPAL